MSRLLVELGYSYVVGEKRHIFMESPGNVAFRETYLAKKLPNRITFVGRRRPEVYLDESFCNVHHVTNKTWLTSDKVRYAKSGKGARYCKTNCCFAGLLL
ncbi:hypothetical protein JG687_00015369 [Phytophthora cactorum]|uniref:Uncharacterized protein n=1 Tax=Phytophthora cactorum TaxID=29920 RepID=A0A8T1TV55_9STRA|nr:hypothetical protein JG687_00015369 [Phytophthora cactorum]